MTELQPVSDALTRLEEVVDRGLHAFMEVGAALIAIRDSGKYRERGAERFEDYCESRFGFSRRRAYQLMEAAEVAQAVCTTVHTDAALLPPLSNERQARELARLPDAESQVAAWAEVQTEHGPQATSAQVREAVARHPSAPPPKPKAAPVRAVPEPAADFPDDDGEPPWECPGCHRRYDADLTDCPECQPTFWPDEDTAPTPIVAAPEPDDFDFPPAHLNTEQKAFWQIHKCVHVTGMDPVIVAATPGAVVVGPSITELGNLARWLSQMVDALRARQERPDLRAVK